MRGGPGAERDVSLLSGEAVAAALRSQGHEVIEIDPRERTFTLPVEAEIVFLALHGAYGEDGSIQRELEGLRVPYTGCSARTSSIAFDKVLTKERCIAAGVRTPAFAVLDSADAEWPANMKTPVVLKPVCQGSSMGLHFLHSTEEGCLREALQDCLKYDTRALLEGWISGRECTVSILEGQVLPVVEVKPRSGVYDYKSKYTAGATEYVCPAELAAGVTDAVQAAALAAFGAVGGGDYARVDVMVDANGTPFVLEINTLPGMTETSLFPKAAAAAGIGYAAVCERMVELALSRHAANEDLLSPPGSRMNI